MEKWMYLMTVIVFGLVLTACAGNKNKVSEPQLSAKEMADEMVEKVEQPMQMELPADQVAPIYHLDPDKLGDYAIKFPMMNVKTNEIAILKAKDEKDVPELEKAAKQRAEEVQKQFETYLPDQYENAKNYKLVTKGKYVLLVISEDADDLVKVFNGFFEQK